MTLDVHTLFMVTIYVGHSRPTAVRLGAEQALRAVCWWGFAHLILSRSIGLFGTYGEEHRSCHPIDLANALLFTAFAVTWTAHGVSTVGLWSRSIW